MSLLSTSGTSMFRSLTSLSRPLILALVLGMGTGCASMKARIAADGSYKDGMSQLEEGDPVSAEASFEEGIALQTTSKETNAHLYAGLAEAYARQNRLDAAVQAAQKGVSIYADNITQLALSEALLLTRDSQGSFDSAKAAVEYCNIVAKANPDLAKRCFASAYLALGRVVRAVGNYDYAVEQFEAAGSSGSKESLVMAEIAQVEILRGNVDKGMAMANKALEEDPDGKEALLARGTAEAIQGDAVKARETLEPLLARSPIATLEFLRVARSFVNKGEFDRAVQMYEMVAAIQPNNPYVWMDLGFVYEQNGKLDEAIESYQTVLDTADDTIRPYIDAADVAAFKAAIAATPPEQDRLDFLATAYINLGTVLMGKNRVDEALDAFGRANAADPTELAVSLAVADLYSAKSDNEAASDVLSGAVTQISNERAALEADATMDAEAKAEASDKLSKTEAEVEKRLGILLYNMKKQDEAEPHLARAAELAPEDPNIQMGLGVVYFNSEKYAEAVPHLTKAVETMAEDRSLIFYLGVSLRRSGDNATSIKYLEKAKSLDPRNKDIYLELHHAYKAVGKSKPARENLMMYQSL